MSLCWRRWVLQMAKVWYVIDGSDGFNFMRRPREESRKCINLGSRGILFKVIQDSLRFLDRLVAHYLQNTRQWDYMWTHHVPSTCNCYIRPEWNPDLTYTACLLLRTVTVASLRYSCQTMELFMCVKVFVRSSLSSSVVCSTFRCPNIFVGLSVQCHDL